MTLKKNKKTKKSQYCLLPTCNYKFPLNLKVIWTSSPILVHDIEQFISSQGCQKWKGEIWTLSSLGS